MKKFEKRVSIVVLSALLASPAFGAKVAVSVNPNPIIPEGACVRFNLYKMDSTGKELPSVLASPAVAVGYSYAFPPVAPVSDKDAKAYYQLGATIGPCDHNSGSSLNNLADPYLYNNGSGFMFDRPDGGLNATFPENFSKVHETKK